MIQQLEIVDIADARITLTSYPIDEDRFTLDRLAKLHEWVDDVRDTLLTGKVISPIPLSPTQQDEIDAWLDAPLVIDAAPVKKPIRAARPRKAIS